eukprot:COSAG06_NODE_243_length_19221_cov_15.057578_6_plen_72_part_00
MADNSDFDKVSSGATVSVGMPPEPVGAVGAEMGAGTRGGPDWLSEVPGAAGGEAGPSRFPGTSRRMQRAVS